MSQRRVMTEYGPGVVVESRTERGRVSHRVEGDGFSIWLTAQQIPEFGQLEWEVNEDRTWDNSTTLPYNPKPQFPAINTGESTIQPNQHIDPDKRLAPADSVSFEERPETGPGPSRDLFASRREAGELYDDDPYFNGESFGTDITVDPKTVSDIRTLQDMYMDAFDAEGSEGEHTVRIKQELDRRLAYGSRRESGADRATLDFAHQHAYDWAESNGFGPEDAESYAEWFVDYVDRLGEIPEYGHDSMVRDWLAEYGAEDPRYARRAAAGDNGAEPPKPNDDALAPAVPEIPEARTSQHQRYLDRFADVDPVVDRTSLQARLDEDPARVVNDVKMANWENSEGIDERTRQAYLLEEADAHIRTAAWADVRKKAIRLRRSGNIQLEAANPQAIVATVTGDHGIYDVAVIRGNILTGSSAITDWTCSCPWGDWAFERQHTFVGRLCSHAYAAYLELQSLNKRKDRPYGWNDKVSRRQVESNAFDDFMDFSNGDTSQAAFEEYRNYREMTGRPVSQDEIDELGRIGVEVSGARYPRQDGRLSTEPGTLTPDLHFIPESHGLERVDVQQDERLDITRTSAIESIHPNGWGPDVERLLSKLKDLWAEENRPGRNQARIDEIRDVTDELRGLGFDSSGVATAMRQAGIYDWDMEGFLQQAFLTEPFAGSGPVDHPGYSTSADALLGTEYDDVDGPGNNPAEMNGDDLMPRGASRTAAEEYFEDGDYLDGEQAPGDDEGDVLAYLKEGGFGGGGGDSEFAAFQARLAAELEEEKQANLRTAGRKFTLAEQQALMDEQPSDGQPLGLDELDLSNTHYLS